MQRSFRSRTTHAMKEIKGRELLENSPLIVFLNYIDEKLGGHRFESKRGRLTSVQQPYRLQIRLPGDIAGGKQTSAARLICHIEPVVLKIIMLLVYFCGVCPHCRRDVSGLEQELYFPY